MADERLQIGYVAIETLELWDRNPKLHALDKLAASIRRYGFKDPPKFEPSLNDGRGGIVEGNGRAQVLRSMKEAGEKAPRGIGVDDSGAWHAPVLFGVDARSQAEAAAYGVDHNALTLLGGDLGLEDLLQIYDEEQLQALLSDTPDTASLLVSFDAPDLEALLQGPNFDPVGAGDQPRLDKKAPITCPACGHEFRP